MALIYADEDFPLAAIEELRRLGQDVLTALEDARANQQIPDDQVLARASQLARVVLTHNHWDYFLLHRRAAQHCGIVTCTRDRDVVALAQRIDQGIQGNLPLDNQLVRVKKPSVPPRRKKP